MRCYQNVGQEGQGFRCNAPPLITTRIGRAPTARRVVLIPFFVLRFARRQRVRLRRELMHYKEAPRFGNCRDPCEIDPLGRW